MARAHSSARRFASMPGASRNGGSEAGTTSSRWARRLPSASSTARITARWPSCTGSKVPPYTATSPGRGAPLALPKPPTEIANPAAARNPHERSWPSPRTRYL